MVFSCFLRVVMGALSVLACTTYCAEEVKPSGKPISPGNFFLSFESHDWNGVIVDQLRQFIAQNIPIICSSALLYAMIHHDYKQSLPATMPDYAKNLPFESRADREALDSEALQLLQSWSVFINLDQDIIILLPEKYPMEISDKNRILNKYGLSENLLLVEPDKIENFFADTKFSHKVVSLNNFKDIFSTSNIPKRFYLSGHGKQAKQIASIQIKQLPTFLKTLSDINTQFVFVNSCYAGGINLLKVQTAIKELIVTKPINYAFVIEATSDTAISLPNFMLPYNFFTNLDLFLSDPHWVFGRAKNISLAKTLQSMSLFGLSVTTFPSIRLPGSHSFFDPIAFDNMTIITWFGLQQNRLSQQLLITRDPVLFFRLAELEKELSQKIDPENLRRYADNEQYRAEIEKIQEEIALTKEKIKQSKPGVPDITITIPATPGHTLLIYPTDLTDVSFIFENTVPYIISKIPSQSEQFIKSISFTTQHPSIKNALTKELLGEKKGFTGLIGRERKAWFIENLFIKHQNGRIDHVKGICLTINRWSAKITNFAQLTYAIVYKYNDSYWEIFKAPDDTPSAEQISQKYYQDFLIMTFNDFRADEASLFEASRGQESPATEKHAFDTFASRVAVAQ